MKTLEEITQESEHDILRELSRAWNTAKNAGLITGEYLSVADMQYCHEHFHETEGGEVMTLEQARTAVRWLEQVNAVDGLIDHDMVSEAIEHAIEEQE